MTLTQTLQLNERYLQLEDLRALDYCEKRWQSEGCPIERWGMVNFIEKMLQELPANGIAYPAVLLLRKKEIQRRTFTLEAPKPTSELVGASACSECGGQGFVYKNGQPDLCRPCLGRGRKQIDVPC